MIIRRLPIAANSKLIIFLFSISVVWCSTATADEASDLARLNQSLVALDAGQFHETVQLLTETPKTSKYFAASAMVMGTAFNRVGQHSKALTALRAAKAAKYPGANINLELGWALLETAAYTEAAFSLNQFLKDQQQHAKATELLGRALLRSGRFRKGVSYLKLAKELNPEFADTVHMELANFAYALGSNKVALKQLDHSAALTPDSPLRQLLQDQFEPLPLLPKVAQKADRAWWGVQSYLGYNDNVLGLGENQSLPNEIDRASSGFFHLGANIGQRKTLSNRSDIYGTLSLGSDHYADFSNFNSMTLRGNARYRNRVKPDTVVSVGGGFESFYIDGNKLRSYWDVIGGAKKSLTDGQSIDLNLRIGTSDYDLDTVFDFRNRDGVNTTLSSSYTKQFTSQVTARAGLSYQSYAAEGDDFDNSGWSAFVEGSKSFAMTTRNGKAYRPKLSLSLAISISNYDNLNSFAGTNGFAAKRKDEQTLVSAGLTVPLNKQLHTFVQFSQLYNHSNVDVFDYKQQRFIVGVTLSGGGK